MEENIEWKKTFGGTEPLIRRQPLMEDDILWMEQSTFDGDRLERTTAFGER